MSQKVPMIFRDVFTTEYTLDVLNNEIELFGTRLELKKFLRQLSESDCIVDRELRKKIVSLTITSMRTLGWNGYDIAEWFKDCGGM